MKEEKEEPVKLSKEEKEWVDKIKRGLQIIEKEKEDTI